MADAAEIPPVPVAARPEDAPPARPRRSLLHALLVEARPKQWVKNVLVVAAPIWKALMEEVLGDAERQEFPVPSDLRCSDGAGVQSVAVDGLVLECPPLERPRLPPPVSDGGVQALTTTEPLREKSAADFLRNDF